MSSRPVRRPLDACLLMGLAAAAFLTACASDGDRLAFPAVPASAPGSDAAQAQVANALGVPAQRTGSTPAGAPTPSEPGSAAVGERVAGIPAFVAVPPGSTVTASAVQRRGSLLQVSLSGRTSSPTAQVLAFYRSTLTAAGFRLAPGAALAPGSTGAAYGRGAQVLVVAVLDRGAERTFSIGGTVTGDARGPAGASVTATAKR